MSREKTEKFVDGQLFVATFLLIPVWVEDQRRLGWLETVWTTILYDELDEFGTCIRSRRVYYKYI